MDVMPETLVRPRNKKWIAIAALLGFGLVWSYLPTIRDLFLFWQDNQDYSSGQLVPLIVLYVVWSRRTELSGLTMYASWLGLGTLLLAQYIRFYGIYDLYGSLERYSLILSIIGMVWFIVGTPFVLRFKWMLVLLFLTVPLPGKLHDAISLPLQDFATRSAVFGLEMIGQPVVREGNVLRISEQNTVAVAEACSGLRMLNAFIVVGVALAFVMPRPLWQKACVVFSTIPIAVLSNSVRLVATVLLFEYAGSKTAERFFHDFAGIAMMPFAMAVIVIELKILNRLWIPDPSVAGEHGNSKPQEGTRRKKRYPATKAATVKRLSGGATSTTAALITLAVLVTAGVGHRWMVARIQVALGQVQHLERPLSSLPLALGPWRGADEPINEAVRKIAGDDDFANRSYRNAENGRMISIYVGYVGRPRTWMSHRPDICYRTHGFEQVSQESQTLLLPDGSSIPSFIYEFKSPQLGAPGQLVLATYIFNGQFLDNLDNINDASSRRVGVFEKRSAYLARIQVSIAATSSRAEDIKSLQDFAKLLHRPIFALLPRPD